MPAISVRMAVGTISMENPLQAEIKRLAPYILLAVTAHIVLLYLLSLIPAAKTIPNRMLDVYLQTQPRPTPEPERSKAYEVGKLTISRPRISTRQIDASTSPEKVMIEQAAQPTNQLALATQYISPPADKDNPHADRPANIETLLNSARQIAREAAKEIPLPKDNLPPLRDRPILPKLAQLLAQKNKPPAGVTEYADGMIKIVTESGNVYCMQPKSHLPQNGPIESESIPMTCP